VKCTFAAGKNFIPRATNMKRIILILFSILIIIPHLQSEQSDIKPMLKTTWKQREAYAMFSPKHERLGCWSIALAQVLFFHGLIPSGQTSYKGKIYTVSADFENPAINIENIVFKIDNSTADINKTETARFLWYSALVTGKDFGTGDYIGNTDVRRERLGRHFKVKTSRIRYPESAKTEVEKFINDELINNRPLLIYVEGKEAGEEGSGHALVIDGYKKESGKTLVHLNFGWEGVSDGWYDLWSPIKSKYGNYNKSDRWIMSIRPNK
jgi:hypothetical protein